MVDIDCGSSTEVLQLDGVDMPGRSHGARSSIIIYMLYNSH